MELTRFFQENPRVALAFSGGVDSAYLLYAAAAAGAQVRPFYVKTPFQPRFEYDDACRLAAGLGIDMRTIRLDVLSDEAVAANPQSRCYHCKRRIFTAIAQAAREEGLPLVIDGTNASDREDDRPGMKALRELGVRSPLREAGLTKADIRRLSAEAGLFTHDKPAYACLATRIPAGTAITAEMLEKTERAEDFLRSLGFWDFRVRMDGGTAKVQLRPEQMDFLLKHRKTILAELKKDYSAVVLDLEARGE